MKHGQDAESSLLLRAKSSHMHHHLGAVRREVGVGQHCALGHAGCASGILKDRDIIRVTFYRVRFGIMGEKRLEPDMKAFVEYPRVVFSLE